MSDFYTRMLKGLLRASRFTTFEQLPALVGQHCLAAGFASVRLFVSDLREDMLREVTGEGLDAGDGGQQLRIDATLAGARFPGHAHAEGATEGGGEPPRAL